MYKTLLALRLGVAYIFIMVSSSNKQNVIGLTLGYQQQGFCLAYVNWLISMCMIMVRQFDFWHLTGDFT